MTSARRLESIILAVATLLLGLNLTYKLVSLTYLYRSPTRSPVNGAHYEPRNLNNIGSHIPF